MKSACIRWLGTGLILYAGIGATQGGSATYNFDTNPTNSIGIYGWNPPSAWQQTNGNPGGYLSLTEAADDLNTVLIFPELDASVPKALEFSADVRIGNGTGEEGRPADGFSINFARSTDPVVVNNTGDLNDFAVVGAPEAGTRTGLSICFLAFGEPGFADPFNVEGIAVRVDGITVIQQSLPVRNGLLEDIESLQTGPWDGGSGSTEYLGWARVQFTVDADGRLTLFYKGAKLIDQVQTPFFPSLGRFVIAGRTGGLNQNQHIDNVSLSTTLADRALITGLRGDRRGFSARITDVGDSIVDADSVVTKLNGDEVQAVITKSGTLTLINYFSTPLLPGGRTHNVEISFSDTLGNQVQRTGTFYVLPYIPTEFAVPIEHVDTNAPGFVARLNQISIVRYPGDPGWIANAERQLAQRYFTDPPTNSIPYPNTINGSSTVAIPTVINWNQAVGYGDPEVFEVGNFTSWSDPARPDAAVPGIPGNDPGNPDDNVAAEILTYLELKKGNYRFGVNSDDGFKVSTARDARDVVGITLGYWCGCRQAFDTYFEFEVIEDGIYPIRLSWWESYGESSLEFFAIDEWGNKTLINDRDLPNHIKAYRQAAGSYPHAVYAKPGVENPEVAPNTTVTLDLVDGTAQIDVEQVRMTLNDLPVTPTVSRTGSQVVVQLSPTGLLAPGSTHRVAINFFDTAANRYDYSWRFHVIDYLLAPEPEYAYGSVDTNLTGFNVRVHQIDQKGGWWLAPLISRAEQQLAGIVGPNVANIPNANLGILAVTNVDHVNWERRATDVTPLEGYEHFSSKSLRPNSLIPGIPGTGTSSHNLESFAVEITTFLQVSNAGYYAFGVNSDDGFKLTISDRAPEHNGALIVTAPAEAAGAYYAVSAGREGGGLAASIKTPISGRIVLADPAVADRPLVNAAAINGNIALIDRGIVEFSVKLTHALTAGAQAVVVANFRDETHPEGIYPFIMTGNPVGIPAVMISKPDGDRIKASLAKGAAVAVRLTPDPTPGLEFDGGRGARDTIGGIAFPQAGVYPLRCIWFQESLGANMEMFTITSDGDYVLMNDLDRTDALQVYRGLQAPHAPKFDTWILEGSTVTMHRSQVGTLLEAASVDGPWSVSTNQNNPQTIVTLPGTGKFYRIQQ